MSDGLGEGHVEELPLFPLPVVLFPGAILPLHIFEDRYRLMMGKLIEEGGNFGVVFWDGESTGVAETGCSAEIQNVKKYPDGNMDLVTVGQHRFKIVDILQEQPYIISTVEYIEDPRTGEKARRLAEHIRTILDDILRLSSKLVDKRFVISGDVPDDPSELSFWVASNFYGSPEDQQELLEMRIPEDRLEEELVVLNAARKHLAAKVSLKDALG